MTRTKEQIYKANKAHRLTHTSVGLDRETLKLIDRVKALQYQRLGITLSRNQVLTLVFKDYVARAEHYGMPDVVEASTN